MIVYHGSDIVVEHPDINHSYRNLDFGKGFYITTNQEQAQRWARRKAALDGNNHAFLNIYEMSENITSLKVLDFKDNLTDWIDFVCECRDGSDKYMEYDIIIGKVANDKVFRVVDMYHAGIWDKSRALKEIRVYPTYDQIAFTTQKAITQVLRFKQYKEV